MDTGEETPLDSAKTWEDSEVREADVQLVSETSHSEPDTHENSVAGEGTRDIEWPDSITAPSVSFSSNTVFATPSASMPALSTASFTSELPSSSVVETRIQSTFQALPSLPLPVPQSAATASLTPQASASSPASGSPMEVPSRSEPFHPLPDFMSVLNMRPVSGNSYSSSSHTASSSNGDSKESFSKVDSLGPGSKDILIDKFRRGQLLFSDSLSVW